MNKNIRYVEVTLGEVYQPLGIVEVPELECVNCLATFSKDFKVIPVKGMNLDAGKVKKFSITIMLCFFSLCS